jgi:ceramide glucosyltransferase
MQGNSMTWTPLPVTEWMLIGLCCLSSVYITVAALMRHGSRPWGMTRPGSQRTRPATISVLKPLCGLEPRLYANLETFCRQTHPHFQRLCEAYPDVDITLVVNDSVHGVNLKVSNLINLAQHARHEVIVIADSDIAVPPDYLHTVCAPLASGQVGVVTCLYRARRVGEVWARLGALFIDEWFVPSVHVARAAGARRFGFGATLALRRETLDAIGGFHELKDCVADDFWLAEYVRKLGLRTHVSELTVTTDVTECDLPSLWLRETRWLRTIRSINPLGFAFLFITFTSPWLIASWLLGLGFDWSGGAIADSTADMIVDLSTSFGLSARLLLHWRTSRDWRSFWRDLPLIALRDLLLWAEWITAAFGSYVIWRGVRIRIVPTVVTPEVNFTDVSDERYDTASRPARVSNHEAKP